MTQHRSPVRFALALSALCCFIVHAAQAQTSDRAEKTMEKARDKFNGADADHDGFLTRDEAKKMPRVSDHFDDIDADHNGKVSMQEIAQYFAAKRKGRTS